MKRPLPRLLVLLVVTILLCLILAAFCLAKRAGAVRGGAPRAGPRRPATAAKSPHLVVDTLNLAHWLRGKAATPLQVADISGAIDATAPALKLRHPGRVMYVLKDRESRFNDEAAHEELRRTAERNGVYIYQAERYADPPPGAKFSAEHSSRGRDDFLMALLASRWKCAALTEDRLRDFDQFRRAVPPFQVYEFSYWRKQPHRDFVRPDSPAYSRLRKPPRLRYQDYFSQCLRELESSRAGPDVEI